MNEWKPIEAYDKLKKKPKNALFWFSDDSDSRNLLIARPELARSFGNRTCTHYMVFEPPK